MVLPHISIPLVFFGEFFYPHALDMYICRYTTAKDMERNRALSETTEKLI